jgi:acyl carrier protein
MTTTYERLRAILVKDYQLAPERVTLDAPLEALGIDSLGLADMLFNVEDEFHITLPPEAVELPTIADVVAFIDGLIATQSVHAHTADAVPMPILLTP